MHLKANPSPTLKHVARLALLGATLSMMPGAFAGDRTVDAAVGGGVGGALGGAVGSEIGGRDGAIIGAAAGAAIGAAVATEGDDHHHHHHSDAAAVRVTRAGHPYGYHCPPGQAKKNRC